MSMILYFVIYKASFKVPITVKYYRNTHFFQFIIETQTWCLSNTIAILIFIYHLKNIKILISIQHFISVAVIIVRYMFYLNVNNKIIIINFIQHNLKNKVSSKHNENFQIKTYFSRVKIIQY